MAAKLTSTNLRSLGTLFVGGTVTGLTDGQLLEQFGTRGDATRAWIVRSRTSRAQTA